MVNIVFMLGVTGWAVSEGNLKKIATKYDMDGTECTYINGHPFKLFTRLMPVRTYKTSLGLPKTVKGANPVFAYYSVCVDKCPKKTTKDIKYLPNKEYPKGVDQLKSWDHDTENLFGFCFPSKDTMKDVAEFVFKDLNKTFGSFGKYMKDLEESWKIVLLMAFMSLIITLLYLYLL